MGIAKLRALRLLWAKVAAWCGAGPATATIHAETSWRMLTRRDPYVNILRNTVAAFTAGVGGADSLTVLPHTQPLGLPDAAARRLARNTSLVLQEEASLWRVVDPASGAGGYETLTEELAAKAWAQFQEIEGEGGLLVSLVLGKLQARIAATAERRGKGHRHAQGADYGNERVRPSRRDRAGGARDRAASPAEADQGASQDQAGDRRGDRCFARRRGADRHSPRCRGRAGGSAADVAPPVRAVRSAARPGGCDPREERPRPAGDARHARSARRSCRAACLHAESVRGWRDRDDCHRIERYRCETRASLPRGIRWGLRRRRSRRGGCFAGRGPHDLARRAAGRNRAALVAAGVARFVYMGCDVINCLTEALELTA